MSIVYEGVAGLLVAEMGFFLLLLAPLPIPWKAKMTNFLSHSATVDSIKYLMKIMVAFVTILFADSSYKVYKAIKLGKDNLSSGSGVDGTNDSYLNANLFQSQRNVVLTGAVVFLTLVLQRFYHMVVEIARYEAKKEAVKAMNKESAKEFLKQEQAREFKKED